MGQKLVDTCDIFKTLQLKGLETIHVKVWIESLAETGSNTVLHQDHVAVGERGKKRVVRIAKNATKPYAATQEPNVEPGVAS